MNNEQSDLI